MALRTPLVHVNGSLVELPTGDSLVTATPTAGDSSTQAATTAFVGGALATQDATAVHLAGTETITGVKTFSSDLNISSSGGTLTVQTNNTFRSVGRMWLRDDEFSATSSLAQPGQHKVFTGSAPATLTLPSLGSSTQQTIWVENIGSADLTVAPSNPNTILVNGTSVGTGGLLLAPGEALMLFHRSSANTNWVGVYQGGRQPKLNAPLAGPTFTGDTTIAANSSLVISGRLMLGRDESATNATLTTDNPVHYYTGTGGHTFTGPSGFLVTHWIHNMGTGDLTVQAPGATAYRFGTGTVTTLTLSPGESLLLSPRYGGLSEYMASYHGGRQPKLNAPLLSPVLTTPTLAASPVTGDNSLAVASTAYVKGQGYITGTGNTTGTAGNITGVVAPLNGGTGVAGTLTGILKANGSGNATVAAVSDYPTLNQSTTGNAATATTATTAGNVSGIVVGANGGTGVANTGKTITLGGNLTTSGAFATTFTMTGATTLTLPTTGTLATTASNITGTAAGLSSTLAIGSGGTGATTAPAALTALGAAPTASPTFSGTVSLAALSTLKLLGTDISSNPYEWQIKHGGAGQNAGILFYDPQLVQNSFNFSRYGELTLQSPSYSVTLAPAGSGNISAGGYTLARLDSPAFINTPTAPTAATGTNTTQLATTAFVKAATDAVALAAGAVTSVYGRAGAVTAQTGDYTAAQVTGAVRSVNSTTPDANGNVVISAGSAYTLPIATNSTLGGVIVGANITENPDGTIGVYRVLPRTSQTTATGSFSVSMDNQEQFGFLLTGGVLIGDSSTYHTDGQKVVFRIQQNSSTLYGVSWSSAFKFPGGTAPTMTQINSKTDYYGFIWNANTSFWDCVAVTQNI